MVLFRCARVGAVVGILAAAVTAVLVPANGVAGVRIAEGDLARIRGADRNFTKRLTYTCEENGVQAGLNVYGGAWWGASQCNSVNLYQNCGSCTTAAQTSFGSQGTYRMDNNGQSNQDVGPCGNLTYGTCGGSANNWSCVGMQTAINPQTGQAYACSDLIGIQNQVGGGGGSGN